LKPEQAPVDTPVEEPAEAPISVEEEANLRMALVSAPVTIPDNPPQKVGFGAVVGERPYVPPVTAASIDYPLENNRNGAIEGTAPAADPAAAQGNVERRALVETSRAASWLPTPSRKPFPLRIGREGFEIYSGSQMMNLKGINYFGFEDGQTSFDGLWQGPTALTYDMVNVVRRIKLMGFNAIRIPFSFKDLYKKTPLNFRRTNCPTTTLATMLSGLTDPEWAGKAQVNLKSARLQARMKAEPQGALPFGIGSRGTCNAYLPNPPRALERFIWVVRFLTRNGFVVVLDNHANLDDTVITDNAFWVRGWTDIMERVAADPYARAYTIFDILNEPDSVNLRWQGYSGCGGVCPGVGDLYHRIMQIGNKINPAALYMVEGCSQGLLGANWGDGFNTDALSVAALNRAAPGSDPNPFFRQLLGAPYRKNLIVSPHVYCPSITFAKSQTSGSSMFARLNRSFGFYNRIGYAYKGDKQVFPVVLGEFGSWLGDRRNGCNARGCMDQELSCMNSLKDYMMNVGEAHDKVHHKVRNWFWWSWNANSGDTGGIVGSDWQSILWFKIHYLQGMSLSPWYQKPINSRL